MNPHTDLRRFVIVGTAGHVDHGKSALIRRLTGTDPDRLPQEQERGMTIDLGFAYFDLPSGARCGIVDVPGHERFVKNMLAGATGTDLVLLVVAADEGVMPQTREHLDILDLLGLDAAIVVITKTDLVDEEMLELVAGDIAEALSGTALAGSPMVAVSALTGAGIPELIAHIERLAASVRPRDTRGPARLPIDRVFSVRGHGTVATGSLIRGRLRVDQQVEILPVGLKSRVRSIEMYGDFVPEVVAPVRCGVNLVGIGAEELARGDQLVAVGSMAAGHIFDARLRLTPNTSRPLRHRQRVRVHHGTAEILGRVHLMETTELAPGQDGLAQLRLESPVVAARGDRFVIRRYSPPLTIGGGEIIDPNPTKLRRGQTERAARLRLIESSGPLEHARRWVQQRGLEPFTLGKLATALQIEPADALALREELGPEISEGAGGTLFAASAITALAQAVAEALAGFHHKRPLMAGMATPHLQAAVGRPPAAAWQAAVAALVAQGTVIAEGGMLRLADHSPRMTPAQEQAHRRALQAIERAGLAPPTREQALLLFAEGGAAEDLLDAMVTRGEIIRVGDLCFAAGALEQARRRLTELYASGGPFTVAAARDALGSSRKYIVPLLEHLDAEGFTRRTGELRAVAVRLPAADDGSAAPEEASANR